MSDKPRPSYLRLVDSVPMKDLPEFKIIEPPKVPTIGELVNEAPHDMLDELFAQSFVTDNAMPHFKTFPISVRFGRFAIVNGDRVIQFYMMDDNVHVMTQAGWIFNLSATSAGHEVKDYFGSMRITDDGALEWDDDRT